MFRLATVAFLLAAAAGAQRIGIGAMLDQDKDSIAIKFVLPNGPADQAGVKAGDRIIAIDGQSTRGIDVNEAVKRIGGPAGEVVKLLLEDKDGQVRTAEVTRGPYRLKPTGPEEFAGTFAVAGAPDQPRITIAIDADNRVTVTPAGDEYDGIGILYCNPNHDFWLIKGVVQAHDNEKVPQEWRGLVAFFEITYAGNGALRATRVWSFYHDRKQHETLYLVPVTGDPPQ